MAHVPTSRERSPKISPCLDIPQPVIIVKKSFGVTKRVFFAMCVKIHLVYDALVVLTVP